MTGPTLNAQFFRNGTRPLTSWAVVSFERFCEVEDMQRYITTMIRHLRDHGVNVKNAQPECLGPVNPTKAGNVLGALQQAARAAYMVEKASPQLIVCVLPGK